jgi:FRG domain
MNAWLKVYQQAKEISTWQDVLFFRGHANASWKLLPTIARTEIKNIEEIEKIAYFDFVTRAGSLLQEKNSSWNNIFAMQHHGFPTRMLDWTENFATALYFALKDAQGDCCVWVLNPFVLNKNSCKRETLPNPDDINGNYQEYFISEDKKIEGNVIAISPLRHHPRIFNQRAGITIHDDLKVPLEKLYPKAVKKILIPQEAQEEAQNFLKIVGITEFTLFPDLDGLARELKMEHFLNTNFTLE